MRTKALPQQTWLSQIAVSDSPSDKFVGSPGLIKSGSTWWACHNWFGSGTSENQTLVYKSIDGGSTWSLEETITGLYHATLFEFASDLYLIGVNSQADDDLVIFKSTDGFATTPSSTTIATDVVYASSGPLTILFQDGYLLMGMADKGGGGSWPEEHRIYLLWCDDADLMTAGNWGKSSPYDYHLTDSVAENLANWDVDSGILEPQLVNLSGSLKMVCRCNNEFEHKGTLLDVSWTPATPTGSVSFNQHIDLPGGSVLCYPVWDSTDSKWWLVSNHRDKLLNSDPNLNRDQLWLSSTSNLTTWTLHKKLLGYPDEVAAGGGNQDLVGWQYVRPVIDGDDLYFASRTGWNGAASDHDANRLTFHRIENFRSLD